MRLNKISTALVSVIIACFTSPAYTTGLAPVASEPTANDEIQIASIIEPIFENLKKGQIRQAIKGFFDLSPLMANQNQLLELFVNKVEKTNKDYGKIFDCRVAATINRVGILQRRHYICQHTNALSRWTIVVGKTSSGWKPLRLDFDDKLFETE